MDVKHLKFFIAVYERKGFGKASRSLGTVQSNVSSRIRDLEQMLGVVLFERQRGHISPTEYGDALYERAAKVLLAVDQTIHSVREMKAEEHQRRSLTVHRKGFTLIELLIVVVILGLLSAFVAPRYFSQVGKSEVQMTRAQIDAFEKALDQYRLDMRRYPTTEQGLRALVEKPSADQAWQGPYLKKREVPNDPWGRPYVYRAPSTVSEYELISYGRDGRPGGSGEDGDVSNLAVR